MLLPAALTASLFVGSPGVASQTSRLDARGFAPIEGDVAAFIQDGLDFLVSLRLVMSLPEDTTHIVVLQDVAEDYRLLTRSALPRRKGYSYELMANDVAQQEVDRTGESMDALAVDRASIDLKAGAAELKVTMKLLVPSGGKSIATCCCSQTALFRRFDGRWAFAGFAFEMECR